jgi:hypothetical protein
MITRPSSATLIEVVRAELRTGVAAAVTDPAASVVLGMVDTVLASVAVRCEYEIAWMHDEIGQIEQLAAELVAARRDPDGEISSAVRALADNRSPDLRLCHVQREYDHAGEVLSRCIEAVAGDVGSPVQARVRQLLEARVAREAHIRATTPLTGRT